VTTSRRVDGRWATGWLPASLLLAALGGCGGGDALDVPTDELQTDGTRRMAERLARFAADVDPERDGYISHLRVDMFREKLAREGDRMSPQERFETRMRLGVELMVSGDPEAGIDQFESLLASIPRGDAKLRRKLELQVKEQLAMAWLRLGEQDNCVRHHGIESCLAPIRGSGVHTEPRGSRNAIAILNEILEVRPKNLAAVWLLNLAHMTLGEYPDGVPSRFLIPPSAFESEDHVRRFTDVADELGVATMGLCGGVCMEDFDVDGDLDLVVSSWGLTDPVRYLRNDLPEGFTDRTRQAGLTGIVGGLNMVHADYDNDGLPDVFVPRGAWRKEAGRIPNSLLRNLGDGRFSDVTEEAGLLSFHPTQTAAWGDYDNDGWLDLFVGNESTVQPRRPHPCQLYHNDGDGTFTERAAEVGVDVTGYAKAAVFGDADNDGLLDLFVSMQDGPNLLLRNEGPRDGRPRGVDVGAGERSATGDAGVLRRPPASAPRPWSFTNVAARAGVTKPFWSFPAWFFDYDNDGWLDIWVSGYQWYSVRKVAKDSMGRPHAGEIPRLYRNRGDGSFEDVTERTGCDDLLLTMGCNFGDLDNDGWLDFYAGTGEPDFMALYPNRMFRNDRGRRFLDVTTSGGFGHLQKGHAVAFGDVDADGDQDVYAVMGGALSGDAFQNALFENPGHGNRWITLRLEGTLSNRSAIGARVRVRIVEPVGSDDAADAAPTTEGARDATTDGPSADPSSGSVERDVHVVVGTGGSFGSQSLQQEIGLGRATAIRFVEVHWPTTGVTQRIEGLELDRVYAIREGEEAAREVR